MKRLSPCSVSLQGITVIPIAIKYNNIFVDAYWHSRKQSFTQHLFSLMTSWAVVCDVWYMEPQSILPGEEPRQFAERWGRQNCSDGHENDYDYDSSVLQAKAQRFCLFYLRGWAG